MIRLQSVPERVLVFEVASEIAGFYRAARGIQGLGFFDEDGGKVAPDKDFCVSREWSDNQRQHQFHSATKHGIGFLLVAGVAIDKTCAIKAVQI